MLSTLSYPAGGVGAGRNTHPQPLDEISLFPGGMIVKMRLRRLKPSVVWRLSHHVFSKGVRGGIAHRKG